MTNASLTTEQIQALEEMLARRMENTGETRLEASNHLADYLEGIVKSIIQQKLTD